MSNIHVAFYIWRKCFRDRLYFRCDSSDLKGKNSEFIKTELDQLTNIYNGRVMLIDDNFQIMEDTYGMDDGKTIVSGDVIQCLKGQGLSLIHI